MKKVALSLLAFALVGAMAFGDDMAPAAKVSGYVNSGVKLVNTSDGTTFQQYANDAGVAGYRGKLTGSVAAANYGVNVTIEKDATAAATVDGAYGWVALTDAFKLEAGSTNSNPLGELDDKGAGYFGASGVAAEYTMGGLIVGAVLNPAATAPSNYAFSYIVGARYTLDKVVTVNVTAGNSGTSTIDKLYATASLTAVPALTLKGGFWDESMATTAANGIDVTAAYAVSDALTAGVVVYDTLTGTSFLTFKPYVSYALGGGLTASAYLLGDTKSNPNYEPQVELDAVIGGAKILTQAKYDTNPSNAATAKAAITVESDFIFSF